MATKRYRTKIEKLGICDPYLAPKILFSPLNLAKAEPKLVFGDTFVYLVENPPSVTGQSMKNYKSTDSHKFFRAGWVNGPQVWHIGLNDLFIFTAKVGECFLYSYEKPVTKLPAFTGTDTPPLTQSQT